MPVFEYVALDSQGRKSKGSVEADSIRTARNRLRGQGIYPTEMHEAAAVQQQASRDVKRFLKLNWVSTKDLAVATRQLATLSGAGIPLVGSLQALSEQIESATLKRAIVTIKEDVEEGNSLARAMSAYPKIFPRLYVNMVASGEASGTLDAVLENLADYLEAQVALRRKISSALFYPALMLVFCVLVVLALFTFVVPSIVDIFKKQGAALPWPTQVMMWFSGFLLGYWWLLIAMVVLAVIGARRYYRSESGRQSFDRVFLKLPLIGNLYRKIATARVSQTLGTLLGSGVGLLVALDIVRNIVGNVHMAQALEESRDGVREGKSLARELGRSGYFPNMLCHMIAVGEQSGKLESMLQRAGKSYENDVNATLTGLTTLIEPIMIIVLGGIVLCIVISILLPMVDLINVVQR